MRIGVVIYLIRETAETCGISLYQLGILIGLNWPHVVYQWTNCQKRPSPLYQSRMHYLTILECKHKGVVFLMKEIDWEEGKITWKEGVPYK